MAGGRRPIIAGNWKMNPNTIEEAIALGKGIKEAAATQKDADVSSSHVCRANSWRKCQCREAGAQLLDP